MWGKQRSFLNRPNENRHLRRARETTTEKIMPTAFRQASTSCLTIPYQFRWDLPHNVYITFTHKMRLWFMCVSMQCVLVYVHVCVFTHLIWWTKDFVFVFFFLSLFLVRTQYTLHDTWCFLYQWEYTTQRTHSNDIPIKPKPNTHILITMAMQRLKREQEWLHYQRDKENVITRLIAASGWASERDRERKKHWHPTKIKINWQKLFAISFRKVFTQFGFVRQPLRYIKSWKSIVKHPVLQSIDTD